LSSLAIATFSLHAALFFQRRILIMSVAVAAAAMGVLL
jgi:hypothetical protein